MRKIDDCLTWINRDVDKQYLTTPLLDVSIRLMRWSPEYKQFIQQACNLIVDRLTAEYEDYKKPHGMSGANCAVPFNIIAYFLNRGQANESVVVMLNPIIFQYSSETEGTDSNCGSVRLKDPIKVRRASSIKVRWWDMEGKEHKGTFTRKNGGFTIQHEVDHNRGILVTDRNKELAQP